MAEGAGRYRVLVVDDSAFMRRVISTTVETDPAFEVVGTARDGLDAIEKVKTLRPDAVTLDIEMPNLDGLGALPRILAQNPRPVVLMCSTLTVAGGHAALKALRLGATDWITKDPDSLGSGDKEGQKELVHKLRAVLAGRPRTGPAAVSTALTRTPVGFPPHTRNFTLGQRPIELIVIGSSTGGPPVLEQIIGMLPADLPVPVVVAQHMPAIFTQSLSERLEDSSKIKVRHADVTMPIEPGTVYIIKGGKHGAVRRGPTGGMIVDVGDQPVSALYRPSVDVLVASGARVKGARCAAAVLTGMGADGAEGVKLLTAAGGPVLTQAGETCAVWGMPRAAFEASPGAAVLPPAEIGAALAHASPAASRAA